MKRVESITLEAFRNKFGILISEGPPTIGYSDGSYYLEAQVHGIRGKGTGTIKIFLTDEQVKGLYEAYTVRSKCYHEMKRDMKRDIIGLIKYRLRGTIRRIEDLMRFTDRLQNYINALGKITATHANIIIHRSNSWNSQRIGTPHVLITTEAEAENGGKYYLGIAVPDRYVEKFIGNLKKYVQD